MSAELSVFVWNEKERRNVEMFCHKYVDIDIRHNSEKNTIIFLGGGEDVE